MTINVGIKDKQKKEIAQVLKKSGFNSLNEFVQKAVEEFIGKQKEDEAELDKITKEIEEFLNKILEEELEDKIQINPNIADLIKKFLEKIKRFKFNLKFENKGTILIDAIYIKDLLNDLIRETKIQNEKFPKEFPFKHSKILEKLKEDFIKKIKKFKI